MERPDINSKKYIYYHKKLGKKMFNNQKYLEDCKKFSEQNVVLPQGDVSGSLPIAVASIRSNFEMWRKGEIKDGAFSWHLQNNLLRIEKELAGNDR